MHTNYWLSVLLTATMCCICDVLLLMEMPLMKLAEADGCHSDGGNIVEDGRERGDMETI